MRAAAFAERVCRGEVLLGAFVLAYPGAATAQIGGAAGLDFQVIDREHTGFSWERVGTHVAAQRATGTAAIVRVRGADPHEISTALDLGAVGVMVPCVSSAEMAGRIVAAAHFPPQGARGAMFGLAGHDFIEIEPRDAVTSAAASTVVIAMIETAAGVEACRGIAGVEGIDAIWIGHHDLSLSLGVPGLFDHPTYLEAEQRIIDAARSHGLPVGMLARDASSSARLFERGFTLVAVGSDIGIYRDALGAIASSVRSAAVQVRLPTAASPTPATHVSRERQ